MVSSLRSGEPYEVTVVIGEDGKMSVAGNSAETSSTEDAELCACPKCDRGTIRISETTYACDNPECKFRGLGRNVCKRDISIDEAKKILTQGKSDLIEDFTSKKGKPFSEKLIFKLKVTKSDLSSLQGLHLQMRKKFPVVEGILAICPKTNVGIIETPTHYQAEPNSAGCKISIMREVSKREITRDEAKELVEKKKSWTIR